MKPRGFLDWTVGILMLIIVLALCLIPTWVFIIGRYLLAPEGFWQKFAVYGVGVWFLGGFQVFGLVIFFMFLCYVFLEPSKFHW